jgi:hypothetical protein
MPSNPLLVLVGGFLGAGKTRLLLHAAERLRSGGARVALITNDQGGGLVDTKLAEVSGIAAEEITGGCFCCRFSHLVQAAENLRAHDPDVILVEPVGSCIDISATVLQPLKQLYGDQFRLAPYTVLVDPQRAAGLLAPDADPDLAYLFRNQIEEADLVCFSKADVYSDFPKLPTGFALRLSAVTGEGVSEWTREILAGSRVPGSRLLEVDYQRYADAEAALGWLNWQTELRLRMPLSPAQVVGPLLDDLDQRLSSLGAEIAHLKILDESGSGYIKASVCRNGEEPVIQGMLDASPAEMHLLLINLRARGAPDLLEEAVKSATANLDADCSVLHFECFRPAPPKPEYRIATYE